MKNVCQAVTRVSFLKENYLPSVKHIIIDEAQNFRSEDGDWYGKAMKIIQADTHKPGILWTFLDYLQKTHPFDCGLPPPYDQQPQEWLTLVVRNATKIYDAMKEQMNEILSFSNGPDIPYEHLKTLVDEARCGHSLEGVLVKPEVNDENAIADYIVTKCLQYFQDGYSGKNIAILCSTAIERDKYRLLLKSKMARQMRKLKLLVDFAEADGAKGDSIVLDSVRRFSGLEREVTYLPSNQNLDTFFYCTLADGVLSSSSTPTKISIINSAWAHERRAPVKGEPGKEAFSPYARALDACKMKTETAR